MRIAVSRNTDGKKRTKLLVHEGIKSTAQRVARTFYRDWRSKRTATIFLISFISLEISIFLSATCDFI